MRSLASPQTISGRVSSTGAAINGNGFTAQRVSTGNYTLRFARPFKLMSLSAASNMQQWTMVLADNFTDDSCRVQFCNSAGAALVDTQFTFTATGA